MSVLEARVVTAGYGSSPIVWEISLQAKVGQVVAIVGPNGAGKSTFLKAVFGLLPLTSGAILLDEIDITALQSYERARVGLAYVPQVSNVYATMSIIENLEIGAFGARALKKSEIKGRITDVLDIFPDLAVMPTKKGGDLSGGQRNMLGMARAMMGNPKALLLDEPTAGLSPKYVDVVWQQVRRIADMGTTIVVVEQNVERAIANSEWVYVLVAGRNRHDGPAEMVATLDLGQIFLGAVAPVVRE